MQMQNNDNNAYLQLLLRSKQSILTTPCTHGVSLALHYCSSYGELILEAKGYFRRDYHMEKNSLKNPQKIR